MLHTFFALALKFLLVILNQFKHKKNNKIIIIELLLNGEFNTTVYYLHNNKIIRVLCFINIVFLTK